MYKIVMILVFISFSVHAMDSLTDNAVMPEEVIATIYGNKILYKDIASTEKDVAEFAKTRGIDYNERTASEIKSFCEFNNLLLKAKELIFYKSQKATMRVASQQEIKDKSEQLLADVKKNPLFTDKEKQKEATSLFILLKLWHENPTKAEDLYKKDYSERYTVSEWTKMKESVSIQEIERFYRITGGNSEKYGAYILDSVRDQIPTLAINLLEKPMTRLELSPSFANEFKNLSIVNCKPFAAFMFEAGAYTKAMPRNSATPAESVK